MTARPGEADSEFQLAGVAKAARAVPRPAAAVAAAVVMDEHLTAGWLATDDRAREHGDGRARRARGPGPRSASRRCPTTRGRRGPGPGRLPRRRRLGRHHRRVGVPGAPARRRLGSSWSAALLGWAAERGATTAYLQVRGDNAPALALYERLGFERHHTYRYLRAPD